jgi:23S rRNA pseudouridine1911/1915/1917 synthase
MLPTMGVPAGQVSLLRLAKDYLRQKYNKPGNVYLGVVSRLDTPVTGVVLLARTSKAADRLNCQFRLRTVKKVYWALVAGEIDPPEGVCRDYLRRHPRHRRMEVTDRQHPAAVEARLSYRTLRQWRTRTLLEIQLETGRKHQIRVQLAHHGNPVLGDRKYGSRHAFAQGIALHARQLEVEHPVRRTALSLFAPLPDLWRRYGAES